MAKPIIKVFDTTYNGALIIFNACNALKVFTEVMDLSNACAIVKLIERKIPMIRKLNEVPPEAQESWLSTPISFKLTESVFETCKKGVDVLRAQGHLNGASIEVYNLLQTLGLRKDDPVADLLEMNEPEPPKAEPVAAVEDATPACAAPADAPASP